MSQIKIQLGNHQYTVVPQRHAYLQHKLGSTLMELGSIAPDEGASMLSGMTAQVYTVLKVFIPELMPEYEFQGYSTKAAYEAQEYDEDADQSPSPDQIIGAFEGAMKVNRLDLLRHLKEVVGQDFLLAQARVAIADATTKALEASPTSPSENGASDSTSSTTPAPTSESSGD